MSVPSMPFLERLMPRTEASSNSEFVRAALPPRFGRWLEIDGETSGTPEAASREQGISTTSQQKSAEQITREVLVQQHHSHSEEVGHEHTIHTVHAEAPPVGPRPADPVPRFSEARPRAPAVSAAQQVTIGQNEQLQRVIEHNVHDAFVTIPAAPTRAPLSEAAQARRMLPVQVESPTVVQVTIDRIDVRGPAVGRQHEQSNPRKRAAPSQSLGDYLRQRKGGGE